MSICFPGCRYPDSAGLNENRRRRVRDPGGAPAAREENRMEQNKKRILIIEDDELNRAVLESVFEDDYEILEAADGQEGLEQLKANEDRICAILLDLIMPVMDGITFLHRISESGLQNDIPIFVVSAYQSTPSISEAYRMGVMDVIAKPVVPFIITRRVNSVIELFAARRQLSSEVQSQQAELMRQQQIIGLNNGMIEVLFAAIEFRSGETGEHVRKIRRITETMLTETSLGAGFSQTEILCIAVASMLHDIGKISIPDAVLNKPGRLTDEERQIMQTHTTLGEQFLGNIPQLKNHEIFSYACDIALHHHERWDGRGYPEGLKGDEISIPAQVVSIADVYEALLSKRVYKDAYSRDKAVQMILNGECGVFSQRLLDAFVECEPKLYAALYPAEPGEEQAADEQ